MARRRKGRAVDGIVLLDKPLELSSNDAVQRVKRLFFAQKAGHTGALDPLATGMLPVCLGEATKFSQFLLDADKTYEVTARLGIRTTTSDADGDVVSRQPVEVSEAQLLDACEQFRGDIQQVPSMFSALKYQGKPLYHYARQGIEVPREARDITMYALDVLRFKDDEVDMRVHCSKGTYIRTIVDDLGQALGCGAYVSKLHRSAVTDYPSERMVTLETLEYLVDKANAEDVSPSTYLDPLLLPMDTAVKRLPAVMLDDIALRYYRNGNPAQCDSETSLEVGQQVRVYDRQEQLFWGVGAIEPDGRVTPKRSVVRE
ncbi:tRNA pseudouridine(55) synthase TruB [Aestuariibacter halophilus]|uniref:tRNA pseudouridine synthase B n=1 Tax=Fluctibacter halophilus TaxID=226011 RepID=A0ABS8G3T7_9ALTE|nr:tRNA pseudouridine(55) synthase TruB [Aestuariibacter halophilus]MCC2615230.1 tRNA pseudouridine(55) synthase TruB [Aestuariibacter halophilus]